MYNFQYIIFSLFPFPLFMYTQHGLLHIIDLGPVWNDLFEFMY